MDGLRDAPNQCDIDQPPLNSQMSMMRVRSSSVTVSLLFLTLQIRSIVSRVMLLVLGELEADLPICKKGQYLLHYSLQRLRHTLTVF